MQQIRAGAAAGGIVAIACAATASQAQEQAAAPIGKQVRIVVASIGGTGPDFIARLLAPKLGDSTRQNVIIENRPSANGVAAAA